MTALARTILAPALAPAAPLSLDERLALTTHTMDHRLDQAAVAFEVNTAHIPSQPVELPDVALVPAPAVVPLQPHTTPIAAVLQRAHTRLTTAGWCAGQRDEQGRMCLVAAIRAEAGQGSTLEGAACAFLLDVIRREFADAETVPSWNDRQTGPATPLRILGQAADLAATRGV
ncbi:hypothetical protein ACGFMM_01435 [Streptomyces sp. NPDC048604]|uniref:DUF6197 family protein n=1 Tax=Streptomyces sp. NPDC048604 TaxID=3365578 RepID=UPI003710EBCE